MKRKRQEQQNRLIINSVFNFTLSASQYEAYDVRAIPLYSLLTSRTVHLAMSNIWDQFKVEGVTIEYTVNGVTTSGAINNCKLFTVTDKGTIGKNINFTQLSTYDTYKSTACATSVSNAVPVHRVEYSDSSSWISTKNTPSTPTILFGIFMVPNGQATYTSTISLNASFRYTVVYDKARLDNSYVQTYVSPEMLLPDASSDTRRKFQVDRIVVKTDEGGPIQRTIAEFSSSLNWEPFFVPGTTKLKFARPSLDNMPIDTTHWHMVYTYKAYETTEFASNELMYRTTDIKVPINQPEVEIDPIAGFRGYVFVDYLPLGNYSNIYFGFYDKNLLTTRSSALSYISTNIIDFNIPVK